MTGSQAERIAKLVLDKFDQLPNKCKPRTHPDGRREWTTLSAIVVAYGKHQDLICVSLATGTKCLPASVLPKCSGLLLHDSHAEVLALRGFNYWLLSETRKVIKDSTHPSPIVSISATGSPGESMDKHAALRSCPFKLKENVSFHLFTTEAPCGDASMELLMDSMPPGTTEPWETDDLERLGPSLQGRGHFSMLGYVRRKPARADADPSNSKSCTDKIAIKQFTSLVAFPTDLLIEKTENAYIQTMIVYADQYNETGYLRAFGPGGRLSNVAQSGKFFEVAKLTHDFPRFAFARAALKVVLPGQQKPKVSNVASLWISHPVGEAGGLLETLVNGVKQGYKQWEDRPAKASVVSRRKLWDLAVELTAIPNPIHDEGDEPKLAPSTLPSTTSLHLEEISMALAQSSYAQAKSASLRSSSNKTKSYITTALGNWHKNEADKDWQRAK